MSYSKTNEKIAIQLREKINDIRDVNHNWEEDEEVITMLEEIESVGYFYDEDSWEVYANDDEYYDESPLNFYVNDDDFFDDIDDDFYDEWSDDNDY